MSMQSRKAFVAEVKGQDADPTQPAMKYPKPDQNELGEPVKYDPKKYFLPLEESDYLRDAMKGVDYATFVTDNTDVLQAVVENGFVHPDDNSRWVAFFSFWREQEGRSFLAPWESMIEKLSDIGIITEMTGTDQFMKTAKMVNRLLIPLPAGVQAVWGTLISKGNKWDMGSIEVTLPPNVAVYLIDSDDPTLSVLDRSLTVKFKSLKGMTPDEKALADGSWTYGEKFHKLGKLGVTLGGISERPPMVGDAFRGTFGLGELGSEKGHGSFKPDLGYDLVVYGSRSYVKTERFYFGNLGPLKASDRPKTDPQAVPNFALWRKGLMVNQANNYFHSIWEASKDDASFRGMFLRHSSGLGDVDTDNETWILPLVMQFGISTNAYPAPFRRAANYLAGPKSPVVQCDSRARVPLDGIAIYAYVAMDPNAVDSDGDIHPELSPIPEECCVMADLPEGTEVVCYRQPSENSNAHVFLKVVHFPEYDRYKGRGLILLGQGASKIMLRLGGADMDDSFMVVYNPKWVEAFKTLRPYPETEKIDVDAAMAVDESQLADDSYYSPSEFLSFTDSLMDDIKYGQREYNERHVAWQIEMAKNGGAGLGTAVNYGTLDFMLSDPDHSASMIADLEERGHVEEAQWIRDYPKFQAARLMTNQEIVIDGNVKDPTLLRLLDKELKGIKAWHEECRVYPESMVSKIPQSKKDVGDFVLAKSMMCKALDKIREIRKDLQQAFKEKEWMLVHPADEELRSFYPRQEQLAILVGGKSKWDTAEQKMVRIDDIVSLRQLWAESWKEELSEPDAEKRGGAYERVCQRIEDELVAYDDISREEIAVEIYYQTYRKYEVTPRYDEQTGEIRGFSDGLLWSPVFTGPFLMALRKARLSGFYKAVDIRPEFRHALLIKHTKDIIRVQVRDHQVFVQNKDGQFDVLVGAIFGRSWNGEFNLQSGLVEFRRGSDICQPSDQFQPPPKAMVHIIRQRKEVDPTKPLKQQAEEVLDQKVRETLNKHKEE